MKLLRTRDLIASGVVSNRMTLWRLINEHDFPPGQLLTPRLRAWDEAAVKDWIASRPPAPKARKQAVAA